MPILCALIVRMLKSQKIDTSAVMKADGVVAIYTGDDVAADGDGGPICGWVVSDRDGSSTFEPPHPILAGKVRYVGDRMLSLLLLKASKRLKQQLSLLRLATKTLTLLWIWQMPLVVLKFMKV